MRSPQPLQFRSWQSTFMMCARIQLAVSRCTSRTRVVVAPLLSLVTQPSSLAANSLWAWQFSL